LYCGGRPSPNPRGHTVILLDDGPATGATMRAAVIAAQARDPAHIVVAAPIAVPEANRLLQTLANAVVAVISPETLGAIGRWYEAFDRFGDREVLALLHDVTP